ncbi:glycosyltransferase family 2 protein [Altererythrobacter sp. GH1-8]|uniref:glycosyltransferase family 2 protein n=1 Tax=Altererythrobacter sp. GH1-8 TaxID=3349333 RepID=UPI00374CA02B
MSALVVIPCLNEAAHLPRLLEALLADPKADKIVVADGGSNDGSRSIVSELAAANDRVVLLDNPDRIQSAGVNRAVATFGDHFDWLVRIDAHSFYPENYVSTLLNAAEKHKARSVVVPMVTRAQGCFQHAVAAAQNNVIGTGAAAHRHTHAEGMFVEHGHHALMEIAAFKRVGGYCEAMHCNEDAELDFRLGQADVAIWLEPAATIGYLPRSTPSALWRQYLRYGQGRARNVRRHGGRLRLRQMLPLFVPFALLGILLAPLSPLLALPGLAYIAAMFVLGILVGMTANSLCGLLCGIPAMIMHAAWGAGFLQEIIRHPRGVPSRFGFSTDTSSPAS